MEGVYSCGERVHAWFTGRSACMGYSFGLMDDIVRANIGEDDATHKRLTQERSGLRDEEVTEMLL